MVDTLKKHMQKELEARHTADSLELRQANRELRAKLETAEAAESKAANELVGARSLLEGVRMQREEALSQLKMDHRADIYLAQAALQKVQKEVAALLEAFEAFKAQKPPTLSNRTGGQALHSHKVLEHIRYIKVTLSKIVIFCRI